MPVSLPLGWAEMGTAPKVGQLATRHPLRVEVLRALAAGKPVELSSFAAAHDLPVASVRYHLDILAAAGAVTVTDGAAEITTEGRELYELSLSSERRQVRDRRKGPRRQADWEDE